MFSISPIFGVRDVDAAMAFYADLGFSVRRSSGADYGFAALEGIELHLGLAREGEHGKSSAYLFVEDSDDLATKWAAAGAEVHPPQDTEWGRHEGALVDLDGNVIRFGAPIAKPTGADRPAAL